MSNWKIHHGDCLEVLKTMPDASVDAVVTDAPYGLSFMGKRWDYDVPTVEVWRECLRVLKPGGHLLAFAGTRTQHRMAVRIEDAGFEIRDMIAWVYGSGFPKSKNVALSIDKGEGHPNRGRAIPTASTFQACDVEQKKKLTSNAVSPYEAKTDAARKWSGWGTALKPAMEPVTVARKPLIGTVAENVLTHGTGAVNVDGCRVNPGEPVPGGGGLKGGAASRHEGWQRAAHFTSEQTQPHAAGRWPANLIHDGSEDVGGLLAEAARFFFQCKDGYNEAWQDQNLPSGLAASAEPSLFQQRKRAVSALSDAATSALPEGLLCVANFPEPSTTATASELGLIAEIVTETIQTIGCEFWHGSKHARLTLTQSHASIVDVQRQTGTTTITASRWKSDGSADPATFTITSSKSDRGVVASRFKYCAKASKADRNDGDENKHPTVKPTDLMRYLCRLVTPPGGVVLDPFMGSGSTGRGAILEGFRFIGIEREAEYVKIAEARIKAASSFQ